MKKLLFSLFSPLQGKVRRGLLLLSLLTTSSLWAYDFQSGDLYYNITSSSEPYTVEVTSGSSEYSGSVTIPETVTYDGTTYSVTSIGDYAFRDCSSLTSITIPNSVTSIGNLAFSWCYGLKSVTLGNSVTSIGEWAFSKCSGLTSITIPNSVTSIGESAFRNCSGLTSVTIPESVTSIGDEAFSGCSALTSVVWNAKNCKNFSGYLYSPFYDIHSQITSFVFGDKVEHIPAYLCYQMSNIPSVIIPNSVTSIGKSAFYDVNIESQRDADGLNYAGRILIGYDGTMPPNTSITIKEGTTVIYDYAFNNDSNLVSITIPNSVTSIGESAFRNCSGLTSITIPNSVTSIGNYAFDGCSGLTSVTIPESVTTIGGFAFRNCSGLTSVTIPESVTSIGESAFRNCSGLTFIASLAEVPPRLGRDAFDYVSTSIPIYVPCEKVATYKATDGWNSFSNIQATVYIEVYVNDDNMGIAKVDSNTISEGSQISATPNYGYHFVQWSDGNTENPRQILVERKMIIFDADIHQGNASTDSNNAAPYTITKDGVTISVSSGILGTYNNEDHYRIYKNKTLTVTSTEDDNISSIEFTCTANNNEKYGPGCFVCETGDYIYSGPVGAWSGNAHEVVFTAASNQVRVTKIVVSFCNDKTYTAYFDKNTYSITTQCNDQQGSVSGPSVSMYLDTITLTATPNVGYHFTRWSDGNTDNPRTLVLTHDTILTAEFAVSYSGQCGDNLYWAYNEDNKTISITGSGKMYDYTQSTQPWLLFQEQINEVTTSNTTTSIGEYAFAGCVRLGKVSLGCGMEEVAANAFAGCTRLYDIYSYALYPPFAELSSFANYNVYLYVPCEKQRDYILDIVWGNFKFIECINLEEVITNGVVVIPSTNDVTITWPTENNADTYTIVIKKENEVFCTLTFNADGYLLNIAFAPGRNGNRPAPSAEQATNGYRFTVTGLESATRYAYDIAVKDASDNIIQSYSGEFTTLSNTPTSIYETQSPISNCQKLIKNGQLLIIRDGKTYNTMGAEIR